MALPGVRTRATIGMQLAAAALLFGITLAPWRDSHRHRTSWRCGTMSAELDEPRADVLLPPLSIEIPDSAAPVPNDFHSSDFPDMRPWPAGMVIGLGSRVRDPMVLGQTRPGFVDSLLSALLAPFGVFGT